jgi:nucleoside-diphosphate-sugar epimerase
MKILITGGTGFVGRNLIARLAPKHDIVTLVRRRPSVALPGNVAVQIVDLAQRLDFGLLPARTDVIVHLAIAEHRFPETASQAFAVNTASTQQLLDYGRRARVKQFILASTGDVYGHRHVGTARETDPANPGSYYAVTKYAAELLVQAYASVLKPCILRLYHPYGTGQTDRLIPRLIEQIRGGTAVRVHPGKRPQLTPTHIDDVAIAFGRAVEKQLTGVYNVAGDTVISLYDLARAIAGIIGNSPVFEEVQEEHGDLAGDSTALKRILGAWPTVPLADGLLRTCVGANEVTPDTCVQVPD